MLNPTLQGEFAFGQDAGADGYAQWVALRQMTTAAAAAKLNLPLGHFCEVWLPGGVRLRGTLRLLNEILFIEETRLRELPLAMGKTVFKFNEIESCLRLD